VAAIHGNLPNQTALITQIPSHHVKGVDDDFEIQGPSARVIHDKDADKGSEEVNLIDISSKPSLRNRRSYAHARRWTDPERLTRFGLSAPPSAANLKFPSYRG
jgi:hypothetical protein